MLFMIHIHMDHVLHGPNILQPYNMLSIYIWAVLYKVCIYMDHIICGPYYTYAISYMIHIAVRQNHAFNFTSSFSGKATGFVSVLYHFKFS